jgi:hypothetical protein
LLKDYQMRDLFYNKYIVIFIIAAKLCIAAEDSLPIMPVSSPCLMLSQVLESRAPKESVVFLDLDKFLGYYTNTNCGVNLKACEGSATSCVLRQGLLSFEHRFVFPDEISNMSDEYILYCMSTDLQYKIGSEFSVFDEVLLPQIQSLIKEGYQIKILTSRDKRFQEDLTQRHLETSKLEKAGLTINDVIFCGEESKYLKALLFLRNSDAKFIYFGDNNILILEEFGGQSHSFLGKTLYLYHLNCAQALCDTLCANSRPEFDKTDLEDFLRYYLSHCECYQIDQVLPAGISAGMIRVFSCEDSKKYVINCLRFDGKAKTSIGGAKEFVDNTFLDLITRELHEEYFNNVSLKDYRVHETTLVSGGKPFFNWTRYVTFFIEEKGYTKAELDRAVIQMNKNAELYTNLANYFGRFAENTTPEADVCDIAKSLVLRITELEDDAAVLPPHQTVKEMLKSLSSDKDALAQSEYKNNGTKFAKKFLFDWTEFREFSVMELSRYMKESGEKFSEKADKIMYKLFGDEENK